MRETSFCNQCGTLLHGSQRLQGACPRCLMKLGFDTPTVRSPGTVPEIAEIQALLPGYEILERIGQGGMGAVYRARQRTLQRIVALKVLLPELGADPTFAERFLREAQALANLNHPGIVHVFDFGQAGDCWFYAMEFVDGQNLREVLRQGPVAPERAIGIVVQLCGALQYAHDQGVVHRDIKPENVLVDRTGTVKLTDFGLAKLLERPEDLGLTRSDQVMGTLHYMAPEQVERPLTVDHRADVYALGVVFYELLTGGLPIGRFAAPSQVREVDPRLDGLVLRALEKDPHRRFPNVRELESRLRGLDRGAAPVAPSTAPVHAYRAHAHHGPVQHRRGSGASWGMGCLVVFFFLVMLGIGAAFLLYSFAAPMPQAELDAGSGVQTVTYPPPTGSNVSFVGTARWLIVLAVLGVLVSVPVVIVFMVRHSRRKREASPPGLDD